MNQLPEQPNMEDGLQRLESRVRQVLKAYQAMQARAQKLEEENESLKNALEEKNRQVKDFQYQLEISKLVNSMGEEQDGLEEFRSKIDEYIREVDLCINFLNREH